MLHRCISRYGIGVGKLRCGRQAVFVYPSNWRVTGRRWTEHQLCLSLRLLLLLMLSSTYLGFMTTLFTDTSSGHENLTFRLDFGGLINPFILFTGRRRQHPSAHALRCFVVCCRPVRR